MNYQKIYDALIAKAQARSVLQGYKEAHHILPRCMGGSDLSSNLVDLTAREHFIAHLLLAHIYNNAKLWVAVIMMKGKKGRYINSRLYDLAKKRRAKLMLGNQYAKGTKVSEKNKEAVRQSNKNRTFTDMMRKKCTFKGRKHTKEHKEKMRQIMKNRVFSEETRLKMSLAQKKRFAKQQDVCFVEEQD